MIMQTLLRDEINPSVTSRILANNILNSLEGQPPTFASRSFLEVNCRVSAFYFRYKVCISSACGVKTYLLAQSYPFALQAQVINRR